MMDARKPVHTGGCQCGAVRYAVYAAPTNPLICHCRTCQKAFGSPFAALVTTSHDQFAWTRGAPAWFASSSAVERGFCPQCGTPLSRQQLDRTQIQISIGSFDDPGKLSPVKQICVDKGVPWFTTLAALDALQTSEILSPEFHDNLKNYQHPDHDTLAWPSAGGQS